MFLARVKLTERKQVMDKWQHCNTNVQKPPRLHRRAAARYLQTDGSSGVLQDSSSMDMSHPLCGHIIDPQDPVSYLMGTKTQTNTSLYNTILIIFEPI